MNHTQKFILAQLSKQHDVHSKTLERLIEHAEDFIYENVTPNHRLKVYDKLITIASSEKGDIN